MYAYAWLENGLACYVYWVTLRLTESTLLLETRSTPLMFALPWLLARMGAHVLIKRLFRRKHDATDIALDWLVYRKRCQYML